MDEIAEKGMAAHWKYKDSKKKIENKFDDWINKIRDLVQNNETDTLDFIDDFKLNLYAEEMYIFTPTGELKTLPKNATALDFAFDIHGDIGRKCIGAKVNHKLVPLNHVLSSGDQVEIITSNKQKPKEAWLDFVVTSKARSNIKQSLKEEVKQIAEQGKESLKRKLKSLKVDYSDKNISELLKLYDFKNPLDLNFQIANGKIDLSKIKNIVEKGGELKFEKVKPVKKAKKFTEEKEIISSFGGKSKEAIILGDDSLKQVDYIIAQCCSPIPGDDVFGFLTISEGIKIHRTNCPNAVQLMSNYAYRVLKAKWKSQTLKEFSVGVEFTGIDGMGILNSLTNLVTGSLNINIKSLNIGSEAGFFNGELNALVHDTKHLDDLMKEMKKIEGIKTVERVY
jgi:GTP pyrophosphokinase